MGEPRVLWTRDDGQFRYVLHLGTAVVSEAKNCNTGEWYHTQSPWDTPWRAIIGLAVEVERLRAAAARAKD